MSRLFKVLHIIILIISAIAVFSTAALASSKTVSGSGGSWSSSATWVGGSLPSNTDTVFIPGGATLTVDGTYSCQAVVLNSNNATTSNVALTLNDASASLSVAQSVHVNAPSSVSGTRTATITTNGGTLTVGSSLRLNAIKNGGTGSFATTLSFTGGGTVSVADTTNIAKNANIPSVIDMTGGGTLIIGNLFTVTGTFTTGAGTVEYSKAGAQTLPALVTTYNNLTFSGSGNKTLGVATTVNGTLTTKLTGSDSVALGAFTLTYGSSATLAYAGSASQTVRFGLFPATLNANLVVNNSNGITLNASRTMGAGKSVTFTSGTLNTGSFTFTAATISGAGSSSGWVNGSLIKAFATGSSSNSFEVGDASVYTPITVNATMSTGGNISAQSVAGDHPQIGTSGLDQTKSVNRYWTLGLLSGAATSYSATFNWGGADVDGGANTANFVAREYASSTWSSPSSSNQTSTSIDVTGLTAFGDFAVAEVNAVTNYTITAGTSGSGSITPSGSVSVASGASQSFAISADANHHIDSVVVDGAKTDSTTSYTFTTVSANHSITAYFSIDKYTITASVNNGSFGSISPSGAVSVDAGNNQSFAISANTNYHIDSVVVDGAKTDSTTSYTFGSVTAAHTIEAYFSIDKYTITASVNDGSFGSISPSGSISVNAGDSQSFTYSANSGYYLAGVLVDGVSVDSTSSYTFTNVLANHTIAVTFGTDSVTITASANTGGAISPSGAVRVVYNGSQSFTITPDAHMQIDSLLVDGSPVDSTTSYTFNNATANHTIRAVFGPVKWTVTTSAGTGGTVTPNGATLVAEGDSLAVTIAANTGYIVDSVFVNGGYRGILSNYTFYNVVGDSSLSVVFKAQPYIISVADGNWNSASTWSLSRIPTSADSVVIAGGTTVTMNANGVAGSMSIEGTLTFSGSNRALTLLTSGGASGNLSISGTVNFVGNNGQRITVPGNFANTGVLNNNSGGASGSMITMNGVGSHTFASTDSIGILRLSSSSLNLTALSPITVTTNVVLLGGKLYLGANNLSLDTLSGNIDTGSVSSYVVTDSTGRIVKKVAAQLEHFPVGTATSFNRVQVQTQIGSDIFSVGVITGVNPASVDNNSGLNKTFDISRAGSDPIDSTTVLLTWSAADEGSAFTRGTAVAWRNDGGPWIEDGVVTSLDSAGSYYTATIFGITTFSHFILGNPGALPVQMAEFTGAPVSSNNVKLEWTTMTEENSYGFYVERRADRSSAWAPVSGLIPAAGTTLEEQHYSWTDAHATAPVYYYRLRFVDLSNMVTMSREIKISTVLGVNDREPLVFKLNQNYPNPFNPTTTINYSVAQSANVSLVVYNTIGQEVATLVNGFQSAGKYTIHWNANNMPSGQYFYRLTSGTNVQVKKMVLIK